MDIEIKEIKITKQQLEEIYDDFKRIDTENGIAVKDSERTELALLQNGKIAAYASGLVEYSLFYLSDMWVEKALRRQGIGKKLLYSIEKRAKAKGCNTIYLWTAGEANAAFYKSCGFDAFTVFENAFGADGINKYGFSKKL